MERSIVQVAKEASLLYCFPDNPFFKSPEGDSQPTHAVQEATYACTSAPVHFLSRIFMMANFIQTPAGYFPSISVIVWVRRIWR